MWWRHFGEQGRYFWSTRFNPYLVIKSRNAWTKFPRYCVLAWLSANTLPLIDASWPIHCREWWAISELKRTLRWICNCWHRFKTRQTVENDATALLRADNYVCLKYHLQISIWKETQVWKVKIFALTYTLVSSYRKISNISQTCIKVEGTIWLPKTVRNCNLVNKSRGLFQCSSLHNILARGIEKHNLLENLYVL